MHRTRTPKVEASRKRLLDAAARVFRERGYSGTTMRAVAQLAGIEAASIYYHYRSKDELIGAVLDFGIAALLSSVKSAIDRLPADASPRLRIETAIEAHLAAVVANGDYMLAMRRVFGQVPRPAWQGHVRLRERYGAMWHRLLTAAREAAVLRPEVDLTLARLFLLGGMNWTVEWYKPRKHPLRGIARAFASFILDGLLVPSAQARMRKPATRRRQ